MSAFSSQPRILVSGGGVIGLSCALELAQAGAQVTLIDAAQFGGMASTAAAGMLAPGAEAIQDSADADYVALCLRSLSLWPEFAARVEAHSGQALSVNRTGSLILAQSSEEAETWSDLTLVRDLGPQPLSGQALASRQPGLGKDVQAALLLDREGHVHPHQVIAALLAALERLGVPRRSGTRLTGLTRHAGRVTGARISTPDGETVEPADQVLICHGFAADLAAELPALGALRPVKGQMASLDARGLDLRRIVRGSAYLIPRGEEVWVGASVERGLSDNQLDEAVTADLIAKAETILPGLEGREVMRRWAGVRPGAQDGRPLIGPAGLEGVYIAAGHYRNGVLAAPETARLMAQLMLQGTDAEIGAFMPDRAASLTTV